MSPIYIIEFGSSKTNLARIFKEKKDKQKSVTVATVKSEGIHAGTIVDFNLAKQTLTSLLDLCEDEYGWKIRSFILGVSGKFIAGKENSFKFNSRDNAIIDLDTIQSIKKLYLRNFVDHSKELLHLFPTAYKMDDRDWLSNPLGFFASTIDTKMFLIEAKKNSLKDFITLSNSCGIKVDNFYSSMFAMCSLASSVEANDEYIFLKLGKEKTDIFTTKNRKIDYLSTINIGGQQISKDISHCLSVSLDEAERIKKMISISEIKAPKNTNQQNLVEIIKERVEEIAKITLSSIPDSKKISKKILVSGGTSLLPGIEEMFLKKTKLPTHRFNPTLHLNESCSPIDLSQGQIGIASLCHLNKSLYDQKTKELRPKSFLNIINYIKNSMCEYI